MIKQAIRTRRALEKVNAEPTDFSELESALRQQCQSIQSSDPTVTQIDAIEDTAMNLHVAMDKYLTAGGYILPVTLTRRRKLISVALEIAHAERNRQKSLASSRFYWAVFMGGLLPFLAITVIGNLPMFAPWRLPILSSLVVFIPIGAILAATYYRARQEVHEDYFLCDRDEA